MTERRQHEGATLAILHQCNTLEIHIGCHVSLGLECGMVQGLGLSIARYSPDWSHLEDSQRRPLLSLHIRGDTDGIE